MVSRLDDLCDAVSPEGNSPTLCPYQTEHTTRLLRPFARYVDAARAAAVHAAAAPTDEASDN